VGCTARRLTLRLMSPEQRNDDLRLDYNETTDLMRGLTDVRFKLVALPLRLRGMDGAPARVVGIED